MHNENEVLEELCRRLEVSEKIIDKELSFLARTKRSRKK